LLDDENVIKTCYEYFKNLPDVKDFLSIDKPVSDYHKNLKELNKPVIIQFLEYLCYLHSDKKEIEYTSLDLYHEFKLYIDNHGINYEISSLKLLCSVRNLNLVGIIQRRDMNQRFSVFVIKTLKKSLGIIDYLDNDQTKLTF
jgi:hypothetical protein